MTLIDLRKAEPAVPTDLVARLNTRWHEKALWLYTAVVLAHWLEHIFQAYQIWIIDLPRPESLGLVGMFLPWLVTSEVMHFGFALFMWVGLIALAPGFSGAAAKWWYASLAIQTWHFIEHSLLQGQALLGSNLFHSSGPVSVGQVWVPRAELHLLYNLLVFVPMVVAVVLHSLPSHDTSPACTCARGAH